MGTTGAPWNLIYADPGTSPNYPVQSKAQNDSIHAALSLAVAAIAPPDVLINGSFQENTRAAASYTLTGGQTAYTVDRFKATSGTGATNVITPTANTPGVYADHSPQRIVWNRSVAGTTASTLEQRIEDVRSANGSTITIGLTGDVAAGTAAVDVNVVQFFGTGGAPSAAVTTSAGTITLDTTVAKRQTLQVTVPSIATKTIGTGNDHYVAVVLSRPVAAGTGAISLYRVDVQRGASNAAPARRDSALNGFLCAAFFQRLTGYIGSGIPTSATILEALVTLEVPMRKQPTAVIAGGGVSDGVNPVIAVSASTVLGGSGPLIRVSATSAGLTLYRGYRLSATTYDLDAEL